MGKVSLFIMFSRILVVSYNIFGCCGYALHQGNKDGYHVGDKADGLTPLHLDPLFFMIRNSSNTTPEPKDKDTATSIYIATHAMNSESYYGIEVTSDVYDFPLQQDERSGILIQISHIEDGRESIRNSIDVGWHVNPGLYGDSKAHFYVYWTRDGHQSTGCYNLQCPGYVPEPNVPTVSGIAIDAVSNPDGVKRTIIFKVFKDNAGDWLMHIGFDSEPYLIGRFPKSLFTSLGDKADNIRLGGFVATRTAQLAPMGSGFLPNNPKSASFSNIQLIDQNTVENQRFNEINLSTRMMRAPILYPRLMLRGSSPTVDL